MEETNAQKPQYWETPLTPLTLFSPVVAFHIKASDAAQSNNSANAREIRTGD